MGTRSISANPCQLIVEQFVASGVKYVFNNPGSREALFFDALHAHPDIHAITALHEGIVAAMAGGYTQAELDVGVMTVHLGAGLAQSLGQLTNVWSGSLPVVVITFAGDTGSHADKVSLDLDHNFGPTSISAPFTKANWTVIEPEGLPQAVSRALRVAKAPPVGPVHLAVYDRLLGSEHVASNIIQDVAGGDRAGYPADDDSERIVRALREADRPLIYVGDGIWKNGAEAGVMALAEHFGIPVAGDMRSVPIKHGLHCGSLDQAVAAIEPDLVVCIGVRHGGQGHLEDFSALTSPQRVIAIGSDAEYLENIPGADLTVLADEGRTIERLSDLAVDGSGAQDFDERRAWAWEHASALRAVRQRAAEGVEARPDRVRPWVLADTLDNALEQIGGGMVMIEQFAVPLDAIGGTNEAGRNVYVRPAGGSEGYGVGGAIGLKLGAPDRPVVGLVGDGSLFYADAGLWTAAHHRVPVLYVIPNNESYGIVAGAFRRADATMKSTGEYAGVALDSIDPVKIADGFGVEGRHVRDEASLADAIDDGLDVVEKEGRPLLLNVHLPSGLPEGARPASPFRLAGGAAGPKSR